MKNRPKWVEALQRKAEDPAEDPQQREQAAKRLGEPPVVEVKEKPHER